MSHRSLGPLFDAALPLAKAWANEDTRPEPPAVTQAPEPNDWKPAGSDTLDVARAYVALRQDRGVTCPCCDQRVQVYRRTIRSAMVRFMTDLLGIAMRTFGTPDVWVSSSSIEGNHMRGGDYAKLAYWGLIEKDSDPNAPSMWRITSDGLAWLHGEITVARYAYVRDGIPIYFSDDDRLSAHEAVHNKFDLAIALGRSHRHRYGPAAHA